MKRKEAKFEPLAIVGMSCLFPKAQSLEDYWANIKEKVDAISEVPATHWNSADYLDSDKKRADHVYTSTGGFLDPVDFVPGDWGIAPSDLDSIDTSQLLSLVVAQGALSDAGYGAARDFNRDNVSVILGLTGTLEMVVPLGARLGHPIWRRAMQHAGIPADITEEVITNIGKAYVGWQENSFPGLLGNVAAGRIANRLNLGGTNCVVDAACGSSLGAINHAALELWTGKTDMVITGGVDTFNDIFMYMCFCKTPALSPTGHARPFSIDNDGTILGEGIGMLVLKRLSDAERDGDRVYACINAVGSSSDGKGKAIYAPSPVGQKKALMRAYEMAAITPRDISLIEAHGTGTNAGDEVETTALKELYGISENGRPWCALGSVKSQIGHTKAAAGSAGIIKAALALYHKVIPPTIKISQPANGVRGEEVPFYMPDKIRPWITDDARPRIAAVSALGFGGSNFHVVVSEYKSEKIVDDWKRSVELVTISGKTPAEIESRLASLTSCKNAYQLRKYAAESRRDFNASDNCRLTFVVEAIHDIEKIVTDITGNLSKKDGSFNLPNGVYYATGEQKAPIGVIFPGQGAQYPGMSLDLVCSNQQAFAAFIEADQAISSLDAQNNHLVDYVYPRPTYDSEKDKLNDEKLRATDIAQPAIGAIALGQYRALEAFGLHADGFAGHSYGELVSLCAAGAFDNATLAKLSRKRGQLMAQGSGDRGGMIAVAADRTFVKEVIAEENLDLVVANHNSPQQVVLSGKTSEIERSREVFKARKLRATVLNVAGAFHSKFVSDAAEPFHAFLASEKISKPSVPVYANTTATPYPSDTEEIKKLLGFQLANQVRFVEIIEKMYADGIRTFIEAGPGGKIIGLIKSILEGRECNIIAVDSSAGKRSGLNDLARVLAQLSAIGYKLEVTRWQDGENWLAQQPQNVKPKLTFPVCGANYKSPAHVKFCEELAKPATAKLITSKTPPAPASQPAVNLPRPAATVAPAPQPQSQQQSQTQQPASYVASAPVMPAATNEALRLSRETLSAMQQLQQQTAELHRRFLEGQETAQRTIMALVSGQSMPAAMPTPVRAQPAVYATQPAQAPVMPQPQASQPIAQVVRATPVAATVAAPVAAAPAAPDTSRIQPVLLDVVSEKTGYPVEMLNLDMDMEADLGIDSIKRVEIMSAMQERLPDAPVVQPDQLGKLRTLTQILQYLGSNTSATATKAPSAATSTATSAAAPDTSRIQPVLLEVVSEKTGYPVEMLNLDMDMEADLGIDSIKRVEIMSAMQERLPDAPVVQPDQLGKLRTLTQILQYLGSNAGAPVSAAPVPQSAGNAGAAAIKPVLIEIVSEKTGYPAEMLNLDMDMEADLGIDSIKRVEIMSAMQERLPDAPVVQPDQLGKLRTLAQILEYLGSGSNNAAQPAAAHSTPAVIPGINGILLEVIADKTGYPTEMLNPDMDMEADLGIDSIKRVEILSAFQERVPEAPVVQPGDLGKFRTIAQILEYLNAGNAAPAAVAAEPAKPAVAIKLEPLALDKAAPEHFPIKRTVLRAYELGASTAAPLKNLKKGDSLIVVDDGYGLAEAVCEHFAAAGYQPCRVKLADVGAAKFLNTIKGFVLIAPLPEKAAHNLWEKSSEEWLKDCFIAAQKAGMAIKANGSGLFATVSRLDGAFGLESPTRTIDPVQGGLAGLSKTIAHEWPEMSVRAIDLDYRFKDMQGAAEKLVRELLQQGPLETGLTRSARYGLREVEEQIDELPGSDMLCQGETVVVTGGARGVTAETALEMAVKYHTNMVLIGRSPEPTPEPAWLKGVTGDAAVKQVILKNSSKKLSPKELEAEFKATMANREVLHNLARINSAGVKALYYSADIRDADETARVIDRARSESGPIRALMHGAGVLRDRRIEDKTRDQLDDVIDTKVAGLRNLLLATTKDDLKAIILFSSFSGRFGRTGQVDYSMANEVLNKAAHKLRINRPGCRVLSFNWGPWDGGMVTPSLRSVFLAEGIGLIPLRDGARQPIVELSQNSSDAVEIGIIGEIASVEAPPPGKKFDKVFDFDINLKENAWLKDHVINGDAVLPMAVAAELLAQAATLRNPGLLFAGYDDLRVLKGLVLKEHNLPVTLYAARPRKCEEGFKVTCEIRSLIGAREIVNIRAEVLLVEQLPTRVPAAVKADAHLVYPDSINEAYQNHLFHGEFLKALQTVEGWSENGIVARSATALDPIAWFARPPMLRWHTDPLVVDAAYQLMILWTTQACGAPSLPSFARHYRQYASSFGKVPVTVSARTRRSGAMMASADIDFIDASGNLLARIEGYECTMNENLRNAFMLRSVGGAE
ncbi:MAG TPA: beta-ketoacyl synthase [Candidatus Riflebacteria bacterium]|jgi:acyl transferase domain-containing protein/NAD(P)-dependent dehydrogenase (short-subunit alcohol dehydrogenase family)|nr:beta-ketoacyl synthase [Candidatus Riflebacteria bacterium]